MNEEREQDKECEGNVDLREMGFSVTYDHFIYLLCSTSMAPW